MKKPAVAALVATVSTLVVTVFAQPPAITIVLTGQSMIRSDLRATKPSAVTAIKALLNGDVVFTNLEAAVAEPGETTHEGRGFLTPPDALDALTAMGFNLLALSGNHAFDLKETGIRNTLRETDRRKIARAGTGNTLAEAAAPAYLQTSKGTVALIASASGLIAPGARATAERPGVNELRVAGRRPRQQRDRRSARFVVEHAAYGGLAPHSAEHSRRQPARGPGDRLPAQSRVRKPVVLDDLHRGDAGAAGAEPVAGEMDARRDRRRRRHRRHARRARCCTAWRSIAGGRSSTTWATSSTTCRRR